MNASKAFFDTDVLPCLMSADQTKADQAESLLAGGGVISVQVLNEFASVAVRKRALSYAEIRAALEPIRAICRLTLLTAETHDLGLRLAERYSFSIYAALIVAAALLAGCEIVYSEDMQHGQRIENRLTLCNPFLAQQQD